MVGALTRMEKPYYSDQEDAQEGQARREDPVTLPRQNSSSHGKQRLSFGRFGSDHGWCAGRRSGGWRQWRRRVRRGDWRVRWWNGCIGWRNRRWRGRQRRVRWRNGCISGQQWRVRGWSRRHGRARGLRRSRCLADNDRWECRRYQQCHSEQDGNTQETHR